MILNSVDSQQILLLLIEKVRPMSIEIIKMSHSCEINRLVKDYLLRCVYFVNEYQFEDDKSTTRNRFKYYCSLILKEYCGNNDPQLEEIASQMGISRATMFNYLNKEMEKTDCLWHFVNNSISENNKADKIFWINVLLGLFPKANHNIIDKESCSCVNDAVHYMISFIFEFCINNVSNNKYGEFDQEFLREIKLNSQEREIYLETFFLKDKKSELHSVSSKIFSEDLYENIDSLKKYNNIPNDEELVHIMEEPSLNTWKMYKRNYKRWLEKDKFVESNLVLQRRHILLMAVIFGLGYYDTIIFVQTGGYRLGLSIKNRELLSYFLYHNEDPEKMKVRLRQ